MVWRPASPRHMTASPARSNAQYYITVAVVAALLVLSWTHTLHMVGPAATDGWSRSISMPSWSLVHFVTSFLMWTVMMTAMMLPSVLPWVLTLSGYERAPVPANAGIALLFLGGYLAIWTAFSGVAAFLQGLLAQTDLLSIQGSLGSDKAAGVLMTIAGLYQLSPLKGACLKHCRSPMGYFLTGWREGRLGAVRMGIGHGFYCVACCWALMLLSFVFGIMNLLWMAGLTLFIVVDHSLASAAWPGVLTGLILFFYGAVLIL